MHSLPIIAPRRGAAKSEFILVVLLIAIATLAIVTVFGRKIASMFTTGTAALDNGKGVKGPTAFDLRGGTGIPGYMTQGNNPIATDPNAPPVPLYGNVPGRPLNPPFNQDVYINPLQGGESVGGLSGPLDGSRPLPPVLTFDPAVGREFRRMARESAADPAGREKFAWLFRDTRTGELRLRGEEFLGTNNGGAPTAAPAPADLDGDGNPDEQLVGSIHTHPNAPQGNFTAPNSSPDIGFQISRGDTVAMVQSGDDTFALVMTTTTPANVDTNGDGITDTPTWQAAANTFDTQYQAYLAAGHNIRDARHLALRDVATQYNMGFYRGDYSGRMVLTQ